MRGDSGNGHGFEEDRLGHMLKQRIFGLFTGKERGAVFEPEEGLSLSRLRSWGQF
jgi:hypothetical protein